jgi:hypothetical protein
MTALAAPSAASATGITINIDGRTTQADPAPVLQRGAVLVPLRGVLENLGARVEYDAADRRIDVAQGGRLVSLRVGQKTAVVALQSVPLSAPPLLIGERAFVPLRSLAELFGYRVSWIAASRTVAIYSEEGATRTVTDHRTALKLGGPFGIEIDFTDATPEEVERLLDAAKAAGAGVIKTRFDWNTLEPEKGGAFQWPFYDTIVREARERDLIVTGILGNSARWASVYARNEDPIVWRNGPPRDSEFPAWQNYVRRTVGRYANDVHSWQIWERPSSDKFRSGQRVYFTVLQLAIKAARESDAKAILYAGEPGGVDLGFTETLGSLPAANQINGIALYPVASFQPGAPARPEEFLRPYYALRDRLAGKGTRDLPVGGLLFPVVGENVTQAEIDAGTVPGIVAANADNTSRLLRIFTPQTQADYLTRASVLALAAGTDKVFWGKLRDDERYERVEPINPELGAGLLQRDFTPRPSYAAYKTLTEQVGDKKFIGALALGPGVVALAFDNGFQGSMAVWAVGPNATVVLNSQGFDPQVPNSVLIPTRADAKILDSTGKEIGGADGRIDLTGRPLWITSIGARTVEMVKANAAANTAKKLRLVSATPTAEGSTSVGVNFQANGGENGVAWRKYSNFRGVAEKIVDVDGRTGLMTEIATDPFKPGDGKFFIFLDVADDFLYFERGVPVEVTVEVKRPAGTGDEIFKALPGFNLEYDSASGVASTAWQNVEPGEGWATYTYRLPDVAAKLPVATFANRNGYDIRVNTFGSRQNLVFGSITVRKLTGKITELNRSE